VKIIYTITTAVFAQILVYSGFIFMTGKLFPTLLFRVYHLFPEPSDRLLLSTVTIMLAGNFLFQRLYYSQSVLTAGSISTVCGILVVNAGGLIIEQRAPNVLMFAGVLLLVVGAVFCIYARARI
jgi:drug/metabolite transporter (DMT)-like permease